MNPELLEAIIGAAELKGQVEYNLKNDSGKKHKRGELLTQYQTNYQILLKPHRNIPQVDTIMTYFETKLGTQNPSSEASSEWSGSAGLIR